MTPGWFRKRRTRQHEKQLGAGVNPAYEMLLCWEIVALTRIDNA